MKEPAHKILIERYINWELVKSRLKRYQNIGKFYALDDLQACSNTAPFYCHYLAWRLGTWQDEKLFEFFDSLLANAIKLPNWNKTRIPQGSEFEIFWSFLWELQVAQMFSNHQSGVEWMNSGPDLQINSTVSQFFVECTIYRKSFGLEEFINELCCQIHPWLKAKHAPFIEYSLPNNAIEPFLDELFHPYLDNGFVNEMIIKSKIISPVQMPKPKYANNLYVFIENSNAESTDLDQPWATTGSPEIFLERAVNEIIAKKTGSNELKLHKPNLLAVNLLLGIDFQIASSLRNIPEPNLGIDIDALYLAKCGINEIPSLGNLVTFFHNSHPIRDLINQ